jgi:hypothetical protein
VTTEQASVVETSRFAARIAPPSVPTRARVAVIGAGLAGVTAARGLEHHGHQVIVFEKSRGVGGRTATRREAERRWDHGAPAFEVTAPWLKPRIAEWVRLGVIEPWQPTVARAAGGVRVPIRNPFHEHVVATEGMSGLAKHLATGLDIRTSTTIERVSYDRGEHWLQRNDGARLGPFDAVVVTAPPAQSAELLRDVTPIAACIASIPMAPRWVALASYAGSTGPEDVLVFEDDVVAFANRLEGPGGSSWTIRATEAWSRAHLEEASESVAAALVARFVALTGFASPARAVGHRWRFAFAERTPFARALVDERVSVVVAGDWSTGYGVEAALRAGREAAGRLLGALHAAHARPEPTTAHASHAPGPPVVALG